MGNDSILVWLQAVETGAIVLALFFTIFQFRKIREDKALAVHQTFSEQMFKLREMMINNEKLRKVWKGGKEGLILEQIKKQNGLEEHLYFAKILFQINEAYFLALKNPKINTDSQDMYLAPWRENFKTDLSAPAFSYIWKNWGIVQNSYNKDFVIEVNDLLTKIELDK